MAKDIQTIKNQFQIIQNETIEDANTANRVGGAGYDLAEFVGENRTGIIPWFETEIQLNAAFPNPSDGQQAWVGTPYPGSVWSAIDGVWSDTGIVPDVGSIDFAEYAKTTDTLGTVIRTGELAQVKGQSTTLAPSLKLFTNEVDKMFTLINYNAKQSTYIRDNGNISTTTKTELFSTDYLKITDITKDIVLSKTYQLTTAVPLAFYDINGKFISTYKASSDFTAQPLTIPAGTIPSSANLIKATIYADTVITNVETYTDTKIAATNTDVDTLQREVIIMNYNSEQNMFITSSGNNGSTSNASLYATGSLKIKDITKDITLSRTFQQGSAIPLAFYDVDNNFISVYRAAIDFSEQLLIIHASSIPTDAYYIRATIYKDTIISNVETIIDSTIEIVNMTTSKLIEYDKEYINSTLSIEQGTVSNGGIYSNSTKAIRTRKFSTNNIFDITINPAYRFYWRIWDKEGNIQTSLNGWSDVSRSLDYTSTVNGTIVFVVFHDDTSVVFPVADFADADFAVHSYVNTPYYVPAAKYSDIEALKKEIGGLVSGKYINHIIVLGQSLSTGYKTSQVLQISQPSLKALMFKHARTLDFGYIFGITKEQYEANPNMYDDLFYSSFNKLIEEGDYGNDTTEWQNSHFEYESPCSGIAEGLYNSYKEEGKPEIPYYLLFTCSGAGAQNILNFQKGTEIYNKTIKDVQKAKELADSMGMYYNVAFVAWIQGEANRTTVIDTYKSIMTNIVNDLNSDIKAITGQYNPVEFMSYQTDQSSYTGATGMRSTIAQFQLAKELPNFNMSAPIYNLQKNSVDYDHLHLTALSSRMMGNHIGREMYRKLYGIHRLFEPTYSITGNTITLKFDRDIVFDSDSLADSDVSLPLVTVNKGFFALNADGIEVLTSIDLIDSRTIIINCSENPTTLKYGYKDEATNTIGGLVREAELLTAYPGNELRLYMPIQTIL